ncbi:MAG: creatininase family protein [Candidatus Latescibacteria bacterium]|nr:creatininase family protein [Candidatus Latescibacterota bacterium]
MSENKTRRGFLGSLAATGLTAGVGAGAAYAKVDAPIRTSNLSSVGNEYVDPRKVLMYECTRKEIRERYASGKLKAAIIPTGSTEQHNEHLAIVMDIAGSLLMSQQAALKLWPQVIVTTPLPLGICPYWMKRQGTITLREETFINVVYDICCSVKTHGIDTILIMNGHGGNGKALKENAPKFASKLGINIEACSYWESISEEQKKEFTETGIVAGHADEFETSIALAAYPERVHRTTYEGTEPYQWNVDQEDLDRIGYYLADWDTPEWDRQSFEDSKLATAEKGEKIIAHAVNWIAEKLQGMIG